MTIPNLTNLFTAANRPVTTALIDKYGDYEAALARLLENPAVAHMFAAYMEQLATLTRAEYDKKKKVRDPARMTGLVFVDALIEADAPPELTGHLTECMALHSQSAWHYTTSGIRCAFLYDLQCCQLYADRQRGVS